MRFTRFFATLFVCALLVLLWASGAKWEGVAFVAGLVVLLSGACAFVALGIESLFGLLRGRR